MKYIIKHYRNVENELMKGMTSLGQIFKEFNDTLNEYQSQPDGDNRKSHAVDSNCRTSKNRLYFLLFKAHIECF